MVKETPDKVGILTVEQMGALLAASYEPDVVATVAIGGLSGELYLKQVISVADLIVRRQGLARGFLQSPYLSL